MKFLIIATQRSGTIMLTAFLNSHPQLKCYAEEGADFLINLKDNEGSNLKYNHVRPETKLQDFKILHLVRKDIFALALSKVINQHKDKYGRPDHVFKSTKAEDLEFPMSDNLPKKEKFLSSLSAYTKSSYQDKGLITISPWELRKKMLYSYYQVTRWIKKLKTYDTLTIFYEDITQGGEETNTMPQNIADQICDFLGVEKHQLTTGMGKVNPKNHEDYIANWKKISQTGSWLLKRYQNKIKRLV
jgi:hypothetical protein